ncbi:hypothetical protein T440DRAFT_521157 [Plenodomus tracheiphilus IPT5]|uniref:Uncharacterized protein n=1 Tax=Plenodomus tracheiphilus IPT5 TaxID=1408161 RepID=A0A6A7AV75_9PLEO|nr:hypothetical protein T440DRAFT_521157 [Plenodomus tracheiphilus IPT5]
MARPWTPPDTDTDAASSPRHDYFSDPYQRPRGDCSPVTVHRWAHHESAKEDNYTGAGARCDTPTEDHQHLRPKPKSVATAPVAVPYTPTKSPQLQCTLDYGNAQTHGLPRYPYTPDSSRIVRRSTGRALSPIPWDTYSSHSSSPVQNALSSCIAHFENLLQTRQPDEDQMEYIVGQFEAMASYLSSPEAHSPRPDEHVFTESENGLGITKADDGDEAKREHGKGMNEEYIAEVGRYIESVRGYITDLKMRLDEVKMLNSIQLDVIQDLRSQMQSVKLGMQTSLGSQEPDTKSPDDDISHLQIVDPPTPSITEFGSDSTATLVNPSSLPTSQILIPKNTATPPQPQTNSKPEQTTRHVSFDTSLPSSQHTHRTLITIIHKPQKRSFWSSFAEALDQFGALLFEEE